MRSGAALFESVPPSDPTRLVRHASRATARLTQLIDAEFANDCVVVSSEVP